MVFESIVADILNRYLGEYVENLDKGQLKIGIWGGKERNPSMFWLFPSSRKKLSRKRKIDFSLHPHSAVLCLRFLRSSVIMRSTMTNRYNLRSRVPTNLIEFVSRPRLIDNKKHRLRKMCVARNIDKKWQLKVFVFLVKCAPDRISWRLNIISKCFVSVAWHHCDYFYGRARENS